MCASGQCTSRDLQCKTLMGSFTQGNDTYACSSSGCQISCASPEFGSNVCYSMQQNFLDGTSCQGGGKCTNGQCEGSSVGKEITSWIQDNKTLVIALSSVIGGLIIIAILSCCISRCRRQRKVPTQKPLPPPMGWNGVNNNPAGYWQGGQAGSQRIRSGEHAGGQWGNDGRWQPPPQQWRAPTVRYA